MIWFTWRQYRTQTWITLAALVGLLAVLLITHDAIVRAYASAGLDVCQGDCSAAIEAFLDVVRRGVTGPVYNVTAAALYGLPALIGLFWGAPLIARELETGTHRLAWNQSVTRTRWLATKLGIVVATTVVSVGTLSLAVTQWATRVDDARRDLTTPLVYAGRGVVPIGYALLALAIGITAGMLIRRTVPAMAATLGLLLGAALSISLWVRAHLTPAVVLNRPIDTSNLDGIIINRETGDLSVVGGDGGLGWVLSNRTLTSTGQPFVGRADPTVCGEGSGPRTCFEWIGSLGLRQEIAYHPADHFWSLQWAEFGLLVGVAGLLIGFCFWWTTRRLS
jgi:hypothetical protein